MSQAILSILLQIGLALPLLGQPYYVAPTGSDGNPGTLEKPFDTIQHAQQAVRQKPGSVLLRGGTYSLAEQLVFNVEDSGSKAIPVVYQAYAKEQPVVRRRSKTGGGIQGQPGGSGLAAE